MTTKPTIPYITHKFTDREWNFIVHLAMCGLPFPDGTRFVKGLRKKANMVRFVNAAQAFCVGPSH
jgi:hypothetical protein